MLYDQCHESQQGIRLWLRTWCSESCSTDKDTCDPQCHWPGGLAKTQIAAIHSSGFRLPAVDLQANNLQFWKALDPPVVRQLHMKPESCLSLLSSILNVCIHTFPLTPNAVWVLLPNLQLAMHFSLICFSLGNVPNFFHSLDPLKLYVWLFVPGAHSPILNWPMPKVQGVLTKQPASECLLILRLHKTNYWAMKYQRDGLSSKEGHIA